MFKNAACASFARATLSAVLGGAAILMWSSATYAAGESKDAKEEEDLELSEVQVTGTRILQPNATSTNPITTITQEEMQRLGIVNVADALTMLVPQNISTYMPSLTGSSQGGMNGSGILGGGGMEVGDRGSFFIGNTIANLRGMDPTFGSRTLTLVDGRRVVSTSNQADVVDMNIIPSNLVERMDVVTGGASATYGSGAMAGVVNVVLNRRVQGIRLDMDYGVSERGDGGNPHISLSGGTAILDGKGHLTGNFEWRKQDAIRDCAAARSWCAESRSTFNNGTGTQLNAAIVPITGYEGLPRRFEVANLRYSQFAPTGTIYLNNVSATTNYRFDDAVDPVTGLLGGQEYALGFRGGSSTVGGSVMNGDGPLATSGTTLRPSNDSKTFFANFDYDFTPTTVLSMQATYGTTNALNKNRYSTGTFCTRFDSPVTATRGTNAAAGTTLVFSIGGNVGARRVDTNAAYSGTRAGSWQPTAGLTTVAPTFATFLGMANDGVTGPGFSFSTGSGISNAVQLATGTRDPAPIRGVAFPFYMPTSLSPSAPSFNFGGHAIGTWVKIKFDDYSPANTGNIYNPSFPNEYWVLDSIRLTSAYDAGTATILPQMGQNAYAFLQNLSPDALYQVQNAFSNSSATGGNAFGSLASGVGSLYGSAPCAGSTAISKVWNPQLQQFTESSTERWTAQVGMKGRFGGDWRWDANYQYGTNDSKTKQHYSATTLRSAFAMDAVIDTRLTRVVNGTTVSNMPSVVGPDGKAGTYGTPICRVTRDGAPVLDINGRPLSGADALANLAANCQPLNIFGTTFSNSAYFKDVDGNRFLDNGVPITYDAATLQQEALRYAYVDTESNGTTDQQTLSLTTSGTLWQGWAGPLTGAFSLDVNFNSNDSPGTKGDLYQKSDLGYAWVSASGGKTRQIEPSIELNMPLVSGLDGINLLSIGGTYRYGDYYVKGGAGTTGEHATQKTPSWRFSAEFAPFDWVRFRMTRSADIRAAGYRELFRYTPLEADQFDVVNPWRERTATSDEGQRERYGQIQVGNPNLKPERSSTLTLGAVLSPGGWAQGMRISIDYSDIRVRDGINLPFNAQMPVQNCFNQSGGVQPTFGPDGEVTNPGNQTAFNPDNQFCKQLTFAQLLDANGEPIPGSRDLTDLVSYTSATYQNGLPYRNRGLDVAWSYNFPLSKAVETAPGSVSLTVRGTRALEASGIQQIANIFPVAANVNPSACGRALEAADPNNVSINGGAPIYNTYNCVNLVGQVQTSQFIPGVTASPKWRGNVQLSYLYGNLTTTLAAQYTGGAKIDLSWVDDPEDPRYHTATGQLTNATVDNNQFKPYVNLSLNGSYNLKVANMQQFQIFGSVSNLMDKDPPFVTGGVGGSSAYSDTFGRAYRMGVRLRF